MEVDGGRWKVEGMEEAEWVLATAIRWPSSSPGTGRIPFRLSGGGPVGYWYWYWY